ncbi:antirestriction protein ArdA [Hafnia alvei]|uniref:antirestriction protein ArdA n=1 Tax=Hafnia alvei TaxID=569 RepID=UPI000B74F11D|nr:antirestriction protein ArdA [Hafnia alvei]MBI0275445.1 antirestriction protein ArdA [Hafnia alvei]PNK98560.1 hypothetical protein CEQ28_013685 [Hafnia alvei]
MDIETAVEKIKADRRKNTCFYDSDICIRFFGLNEHDLWLSAEDIADNYDGSLRQYLEAIIGTSEASKVLNLDYIVVDVEGDQLAQSFYSGQCFNWSGYADALEELNSCHLDLEIFKAGLSLGIPASEVSDKYFGHYACLEDFGRDYYRNCAVEGIPETFEKYIDFEGYGRDIVINDFTECDKYYFYSS